MAHSFLCFGAAHEAERALKISHSTTPSLSSRCQLTFLRASDPPVLSLLSSSPGQL